MSLTTKHIRAKYRHLPAEQIRAEHLLTSARLRCQGGINLIDHTPVLKKAKAKA